MTELQDLGLLRYVISQNTDGLHLASGIHPERLAELHGNGTLMRCVACDTQFPRAQIGWDARRLGPGYRTDRPTPGQPACPACGGRLVSSVVNFGDALPVRELRMASRHAQRCDVMLVLGSSLVVNPAASLVAVAVESGAKVVLVNRGNTPYDDAVTLRLEAGIADVLLPAVQRTKELLADERGARRGAAS